MSDNSLLEDMLNYSEDIEAIFQEYVLTKDQEDDRSVFCFFEGSDDYKYYGSRIKMFTDKNIIDFDCKGKDNVLTLYGMIKENTASLCNELLFFIDKDFDKNNNSCEDIYITPCYSIENFYITDTAIIDFLRGELKISKNGCEEDKLDFDKGFNFIIEKRREFINEIAMLNVWYSLQKNKSIAYKEKPDLKKLKSLKKLEMPLEISRLKRLTPNYIEVTDIDIQNEKSRLASNPIANFRGKYFRDFLFQILNKIITDSNRPREIFSKKRKVNLPIGKDNLISVLSQYADTPRCLKKYLKKKISLEENLRHSAN